MSGPRVERLVKMTNFMTGEAMQRFTKTLKAIGIDQALADQGAKSGDTVQIDNIEFEYKNG